MKNVQAYLGIVSVKLSTGEEVPYHRADYVRSPDSYHNMPKSYKEIVSALFRSEPLEGVLLPLECHRRAWNEAKATAWTMWRLWMDDTRRKRHPRFHVRAQQLTGIGWKRVSP